MLDAAKQCKAFCDAHSNDLSKSIDSIEVFEAINKKKVDELQPKYLELINNASEDEKKEYNSLIEIISTNVAENNLTDLKKNYKTLENLVNSTKKDDNDGN